MTNYTKTMMESLAEVREIQEDNMDLMRKAAGGAMQTLKMKDGKLKMDSFTASAVIQVYDKVNPANQKKMAKMIFHLFTLICFFRFKESIQHTF